MRKGLAYVRLSAKQKRRLKKLARRPDSEIDFSDIPELAEKFWRNAVRNPFYRPVKKQLTLRLDADVIAWLRRQGKGYQTRANALLRAAMLEDAAKKRAKNRGSDAVSVRTFPPPLGLLPDAGLYLINSTSDPLTHVSTFSAIAVVVGLARSSMGRDAINLRIHSPSAKR